MVDIRFEGGSVTGDDMSVASLFYERCASTLINPVPANTQGYRLFRYDKSDSRQLRITSIGTDQHDNSTYHWYIDGVRVDSISGPAAIGSVMQPYRLPRPLRVDLSIELKIDNDNGKAYPNDSAALPVDRVPYECVVSGFWG